MFTIIVKEDNYAVSSLIVYEQTFRCNISILQNNATASIRKEYDNA